MISLITGGTGFLGKSVVRLLLAECTEVRCLARTPTKAAELSASIGSGPAIRGQLRMAYGSLMDSATLDTALQGVEVVYHLAASLRGGPAVLFLNNVIGTRNLIRACGRAGVKRIVLISSLAVYGTAGLAAGSEVTETIPLDAEPHRRDPYTFSKVAQEHAAREEAAQAHVQLTIVRPGVIYGPTRDCISGRVGLQIGNTILRMGNQRLPYTFVENLAKAIILAGTTPAAAGQAFSVVDDSPPTARQLLRQYRRSGRRVRVVPIPRWAIQPLSKACVWYNRKSRGQLPAVLTAYKSASMWKPLRYSNARAKEVLGWRPEVGFEEGLQRTLDWLKQRG